MGGEKLLHWRKQEQRNGITPAWAGKSIIHDRVFRCRQDHPRMGGEKPDAMHSCITSRGSPPHGRGKVINARLANVVHRITPAWAGKRLFKMRVRAQLEDHPRMGGEKRSGRNARSRPPGSPPHGRGKALAFDVSKCLLGITPAWAGKRLKRSHRSGIFISGPIPFHSVLHRPAGSGGSRAGRDGSPAGQPQNAGPA